MAGGNSNFDQISAIVNDYFMKTMPDLVFDKMPLLNLLHKKGPKPRGGDKVRQPVLYQFTVDGAYNDYDTGDTSAEDQIDAAEFEWKLHRQHITISIPELNRSSGPEAVFSLLNSKRMGAAKAIRKGMCDLLYSATTTDTSTGICGLPLLLGNGTWPSTGYLTAGNINKSTYSWWQGKQQTETGTLGGREVMQDLWFDIAEGTDVPNLIISDYAAMKAHQSEVTIMNSTERFTNTNQLLSGFTTITFNGCAWVADRHCTATELYMLQTDYLELVSHKNENFRWDGFQKPIAQNVQTGWIYWMGALTVSDPSMCGIIHKT